MELLKDIIVDFCLFSLIEGYIFCLFFEKIGGCKKFKWYQVFILSMGNCFISQTFPPLLYQIVMIIWMYIYLKILNKKEKNILLYSAISMIILLIIEMIYNIALEVIIGLDGFIMNKFNLFLLILPIKLFEFILVYKFRLKK